MNSSGEIVINVTGVVNVENSEKYATRIRAALKNNASLIVISMDKTTEITCASFLAFVVSIAKTMEIAKKKLSINGVTSKNKVLLNISRLSKYIEK